MGEPPMAAECWDAFFARVFEISLASARLPSRENGKSMMSGSQKRLKRKGSTAASESGPPGWKRTTPTRFEIRAIPVDPQIPRQVHTTLLTNRPLLQRVES